jgi:hypothetical protein
VTYWLNDQTRINVGSQEGDSGGPVMNAQIAQGIVSNATTTDTWYTPLEYGRAAIGYQPCVTGNFNPCQ